MNKKFLITLLTSSNEKLLKLSYDSVVNQKNHNIDYTIIIVVNSLNSDYYQNVCNEFTNIDVEIIQTKSNGKPGMGHNSLFKIFYEKTNFDYMISLDGDDFLYPYALHQLQKCFTINQHLDVVSIYGNDTLRSFNNSDSQADIYLTNNFYLRMGYNIPKVFHESTSLKNPFSSDIKKNGIITIIRFILCSRKFVENNINSDLYCNQCYILDDYKFYLNFIDNIFNKNIKGMIINSDHIYLYNNINENSISIKNENKYNFDYQIIENYYNEFKHLQKHIGKDWNLKNIDYHTLTPPFYLDKINISKNSDNTFNLSKDDLIHNKNYKYCIDFSSNIAIKYYNILITNIENLLFEHNQHHKAFDLCNFLLDNNNHDRKLFIYTAICYYYFNNTQKVIEYMDKSEFMKFKYKQLLDFYEKNNI